MGQTGWPTDRQADWQIDRQVHPGGRWARYHTYQNRLAIRSEGTDRQPHHGRRRVAETYSGAAGAAISCVKLTLLLSVFSSAVSTTTMWSNEEQSAYRILVIPFLAKSGLLLAVGVIVECPSCLHVFV